ncbi:MAG: DUF5686 family protein [Bacteroidetes bacterium]|nr:DUF5686 family protein [Bacteroidota bacterium]MDA1224085.1 DUF5686 family protein [Bacteroidota bacterium]
MFNLTISVGRNTSGICKTQFFKYTLIQLLILLLGFQFTQLQAQKRSGSTIIGLVVDTASAPLPMVQIFNRAGAKMGQTRLDGNFNLRLEPGAYKLIFSHPNYHSVEIPLIVKLNQNDTLNIRLSHKTEKIGAVEIHREYKDPGPEYMRKTIEKRDYWHDQIANQSATLYIKAFQLNATKKKMKAVKSSPVESDPSSLTSSAIPEKAKTPTEPRDTGPQAKAFVEIVMQRDATTDGKIKEIKDGVTKIGARDNLVGLYYLTTTDGDFNLYQNLIKAPALSSMPVMSPLSNSAILAYRFRYLGSYQDSTYGRILRIGVNSRQTANATFTGELHIVDSTFWVYKSFLKFPKHLMGEYDEMQINQYYKLDSAQHLLIDSQRFNYVTKMGASTNNATTYVQYKAITLKPTFPKNHFGLEISRTNQEAYERDSSYWEKQRTQSLNHNEIKFINRADSIRRVQTSDKYLDSVEAEINRITFKSLVIMGQVYQNRKKGLDFNMAPLWISALPFWPGGPRISLYCTIKKILPNKQEYYFSPNISYGINNKDLQGTMDFFHMYNPIKRSTYTVSVGKQFKLINSNASYVDVFRRNNNYTEKHILISHKQELVNGLYLRVRGLFAQRSSIQNFTFSSFGDSLFENNVPSKFPTTNTFQNEIRLSYTPFQRYILEPKQKIILESNWPTFSVEYKQATPGILGSIIDFKKLQYTIEQEIPLGLSGKSTIIANSGSFLNHNLLSDMDYTYQRGSDPRLFNQPLSNFQQLDSTFPTFNRFVQLHYIHEFNGSIVNKIPFLKILKLTERVGANFLYAPERRNMFYYEGFIGIDKAIRIARERWRIGYYFTAGYSNIFEKPRIGFKINIQGYNRYNNVWR